MKKVLLVFSVVLLVVVIYVVSTIVGTAGIFTEIQATTDNVCTRVDVFPGTEDVAIDQVTGMVFVSADDRRAGLAESGARPQGGIFAFHIDNPETVTKVSLDAPADFHPHGISLWSGRDGETANAKRLMVINHAETGNQIVEIFDVGEGGVLAHVDSVSFADMTSPNDLVAVGPSSFYATNDRGYRDGVMALLETYLALPASSAVYFDGKQGQIAVEGLKFGNGINVSGDGSTIYIAEVFRRSIGVYQRQLETGQLTQTKTIELGTGPDNIDVAQDGTLWVASHPKLFEFVAHAEDANVNAPTQIQSVNPETGEVRDRIVMLDGEINAASVGAVYADKVVIGAVFDGHVMVCEAG